MALFVADPRPILSPSAQALPTRWRLPATTTDGASRPGTAGLVGPLSFARTVAPELSEVARRENPDLTVEVRSMTSLPVGDGAWAAAIALYVLVPADVVADVEAAGLSVIVQLARAPDPAVEYPSRRCCLVAQQVDA